jgi:hypothetical protein
MHRVPLCVEMVLDCQGLSSLIIAVLYDPLRTHCFERSEDSVDEVTAVGLRYWVTVRTWYVCCAKVSLLSACHPPLAVESYVSCTRYVQQDATWY